MSVHRAKSSRNGRPQIRRAAFYDLDGTLVDLNILMFEAFKGVSRDRLVELGRDYCERVLIGHLYPKGIELIEANRRAGLEPVLVTGSPDWVIAPLAEPLNIPDFSATP